MKKDHPIGHRDPRTEMVSSTYLQLAADLMVSKKQDAHYWIDVPVPVRPSDRVAFEELRQLAVFLPLAAVVFAYFKFAAVGAVVAFFAVLPVMLFLNARLRDAIQKQGAESRRRDGGRYAFTQVICEEFELTPQDVTLQLVLKMCADFKRFVEVSDRLIAQDKAAARQAKSPVKAVAASVPNRSVVPAAAVLATGVAATGFAAQDNGLMLQINPATGFPMVNDVQDMHGNLYGTSNVDDVFEDYAPVHMQDDSAMFGAQDFAQPAFQDVAFAFNQD